MKTLNKWLVMTSVAALSLLCAMDVGAQGGGGGGGGGRGGGRGGFDPAQQMETYKTRLEVTDETEWGVIRGLIEKVQAAQTELQALTLGFGGGRGGRGGRGGGGAGGAGAAGGDPAAGGGGGGGGGGRGGRGFTPNPAVTALQAAIDSNSTEQIKAGLARYRDARKAAETKLTAAQDALKKVLKVKQEAVALQLRLVN